MADPGLADIQNDPNYVNANAATKQAIFDKFSAKDQNYTGANDATKAAIRQKFGLVAADNPPTEEPADAAPTAGGEGSGVIPASRRPGMVEPASTISGKPDIKNIFEQKSALEKTLKAAGKDPSKDPQWQALTRQLGRGQAQVAQEAAQFGGVAGEGIGGAVKGAAQTIAKEGFGGAAKIGIEKIPGVKTIERAFSKAPQQAEAAAKDSAEDLRRKALTEAETGAAAKEQETTQARQAAQEAAQKIEQVHNQAAEAVEAQQRTAEKAIADEKERVQKNLGSAVKAANDDVEQSLRKVNQMRQQRLPPASKPKDYDLPQFIRGKPIETEVPARARPEPQPGAGGISNEIQQTIQQARQKVTDHASRLYDMGKLVAGKEPIDVSGLGQEVGKFMASLPEELQASVPPLIRNLANSETSTMTLEELQALRTTLRDFGYNPKLTPSLKSGPFQMLAGKANSILHSSSNPVGVRKGVRIIDAGDKFYASNMKQFQSQTMQKIVDDVRDGLPMDAKKVVDTVAQSGESSTLKRLVDIGGERVRIQLRNADFDNLMAAARKPGSKEIDAKRLLKEMDDRVKEKTLGTLYGPDAAEMLSLAKKLAAKDGALPLSDLKPGNFKLMLQRANDLQARLPELQKITEPSKAEAVRATAMKSAGERAETSPTAEVTSTRLVPKNDADKLREQGAKEGEAERAKGETKAEKLAGLRTDLRDYVSQLKQSSLATEDVASKTSEIVGKMKTRDLLSQEQYDKYLEQIKSVEDKFAASKKALADKKTAQKKLLTIGAGVLASVGLWENRRVLLDVARGAGL